MSSAALVSYLEGADPAVAPCLTALDEAILAVHPGFDVAVKYGIVMYALGGDWRHWVCAIDANPRRACLRFLYGVMLTDPRCVLRAGSSTLKTWDLRLDEVVDADAVGAFVAEAVAGYPRFRAEAPQIAAAAKREAAERAASRAPGRRRPAKDA